MRSIRVEDFEGVKSHENVTVITCGNVTEVRYNRMGGHPCKIKRLDKERYVYLPTGEVRQVQHTASRADDLKSVRMSMRNLRQLINANTSDPTRCKWVTLTYAENMTDPEQLYHDFKAFVKRMRYTYGEFQYIIAIEPQGRGAWHIHAILIFPGKAPFISNDDIARLWGHGFTNTRKLSDVDNVGAYLTAYLADLELTDGTAIPDGAELITKDITDENGKTKSKRFIKGARLYMYPAGMRFYRTSRNVQQPITKTMTEQEAEKLTDGQTLTYEATHYIFDEEDPHGFQNLVNVRYYNRIRRTDHDTRRMARKVVHRLQSATA